MHRFIIGTVALCMLAACTFVSKGTIVVGRNCPGCEHFPAADSVAVAIAPVLERYGFLPVWSMREGNGPCTGARGCSWAPEGKGWLQPSIMVDSPPSGPITIRIESRHDGPGRDSRVVVLTDEMAKTLSEQFGGSNVVVR